MSFAQSAHERPRFFSDIPIAWIEPAHRAFADFRTRHQRNLDCFEVILADGDDGGFTVSFSVKDTIVNDGDAITITRPTSCGLGETFHFDAEGNLVRHSYMRH